jgi:hypothetical protein
MRILVRHTLCQNPSSVTASAHVYSLFGGAPTAPALGTVAWRSHRSSNSLASLAPPVCPFFLLETSLVWLIATGQYRAAAQGAGAVGAVPNTALES